MIHCPKCKSHDLSRLHRHLWDKLLSLFFNLYPFTCEGCGYCFRARFHNGPPPTLD